MNRIRMGLSITIIIGAVWAAAGLFDSLRHFAAGVILSAVAMALYGLVDFLDAHRDEQLARGREHVWERRSAEW